MELTFENLYEFTKDNCNEAFEETINKGLIKKSIKEGMDINFPNHPDLKPFKYKESFLVTLFLDLRDSTKRAFEIGAQNTFITMQTLLPTLALIVRETSGFVVDYPGDGIMAHWEHLLFPRRAIFNSIKAASYMQESINDIINPILVEYNLPKLNFGIGVSSGKVILTKVGIKGFYSSKAIGNSINFASKLASAENNSDGSILVGKNTLNRVFVSTNNEPDIIVEEKGSYSNITPTEKLALPRLPDDEIDRIVNEILKN